ncbi:MDR family MFS transporter [Georgenia satyanarayanai]|uniref:MDR family MFS transporter n=1 Tax=Georgenia satyanarayanai TaxID=860221 RepID=UPI00126538A7|nr:MDR family MFS transporter [Georgenia satyanarayanai]
MSVDERTTPATTEVEETIPGQVKLVIGILLVASFVMILNETVMGVAIPRLMEEFAVTAATAQWLTTAFMLTMAVVIPTTGLILTRFSTRSVFLAAMGTFTAGTALAAVAPVFPVLVAARVVQASGTAVMLPLLITTVLTFVPVSRRGRTMGLISIVIAVAPAVGPTFSGFVLANLGWRWMFLTLLPIAAVALVVGGSLVKNITTPRAVPVDVVSIVLSAVAFGGLIYGLSSIGEATEGHAAVSPALPLTIGVLSLAVFTWRQLGLQRQDAALLDLRPFRSRTFTVSLLMMLISMGALFGTLILLPIFLQNVMGLTTLQTGLVLLPGGLTMGLIAPLVGRLFDRVGPRPLVIPGSVVVATALSLMTLLSAASAAWHVVVIHVLLSVGLGFLMTPLMTSALGSVQPALYSHGSAILNTLQQLAGGAGTALFITVMTTRTSSRVAEGLGAVEAQAGGVHDAFLCGAALAVVAVAFSFLVRRPTTAVPATTGH